MEPAGDTLQYGPLYPSSLELFADEITLPDNAVDKFPKNIGPRVIYLPNTKQYLKIGYGITPSEAEAMQLLALKTSVPVPRVDRVGQRGDSGYVLMSEIEGQPLADVWTDLQPGARTAIIQELRGYILEWRALPADYYGAMGHRPCQDIFSKHYPMRGGPKIDYGPYKTRSEYNAGIKRALQMSRPPETFDSRDEPLGRKIDTLQDTDIVFTHGDIHCGNITLRHGQGWQDFWDYRLRYYRIQHQRQRVLRNTIKSKKSGMESCCGFNLRWGN